MIAQKPQEYEMQDMQRTQESVESQLFAGLTFPEVPKTRVVVRNDLITSPPISKPSIIDLESQFEDASETSRLISQPEHAPSAPPQVMNIVPAMNSVRPPEQTRQADVEAAERKPINMNKLYTPLEVLTNPHDTIRYPDLPEIVRRPASHPHPQTMARPAYNNNNIAMAPPTAYAPVPMTQMYAQSAPQQQQQQQQQLQPAATSNAAESALVHELLAENSRLSSEVQALRQQLSTQNPVHTPQLQATTQVQTHQTQGNTQAGIHIPAPGAREVPTQGVKYVCCGGCRQWLRAHRDAVFVMCSHCDAVNNCSLVPVTGRTSAQDEADRQAQHQQQVNSSGVYAFMDCFTRTFF